MTSFEMNKISKYQCQHMEFHLTSSQSNRIDVDITAFVLKHKIYSWRKERQISWMSMALKMLKLYRSPLQPRHKCLCTFDWGHRHLETGACVTRDTLRLPRGLVATSLLSISCQSTYLLMHWLLSFCVCLWWVEALSISKIFSRRQFGARQLCCREVENVVASLIATSTACQRT